MAGMVRPDHRFEKGPKQTPCPRPPRHVLVIDLWISTTCLAQATMRYSASREECNHNDRDMKPSDEV